MPIILLIALLLQSTLAASAQSARNGGFVTTTDGVRLHYLEAGHGPALLFIPGFTGAAEFWEPQIQAFSVSHRVIAMDPRSQGDSQKTDEGNYTDRRAQDIRDVIDRLNLGPVVVIAWSRGVTETLSYVQQFGTNAVRALVLVDGPIMRAPGPNAVENLSAEANAIQRDRRAYTDKSARGMFRRPHSEDFYQRIITANLKTPTPVAVALQADALQFDYRQTLKQIRIPTLFASQSDTPTAQARIFAADTPGGRVEQFPGSGHALFLDDPERFNNVISAFIRTLSGS